VAGDSRGYFDDLASDWAGKYDSSPFFRRRLDTAVDWALGETTAAGRAPEDVHLLDYGCGSGVITSALLAQGFRVTAVDASPGMVEQAARELAARHPGGSFRVLLAGQEGLPDEVSEQRFDGVLSLGVLEYVEDPEPLLAALADVVREHGWLLVSVPNRRSLFRRLEGAAARHPGLFGRIPGLRRLAANADYLRYSRHQWTAAEMGALMARNGLELARQEFFVSPWGLFEDRSWVGGKWIGLAHRPGAGRR